MYVFLMYTQKGVAHKFTIILNKVDRALQKLRVRQNVLQRGDSKKASA